MNIIYLEFSYETYFLFLLNNYVLDVNDYYIINLQI